MATVDVIIPCYNYGRYLRDCVNSVLTQAGVDVRVLIIDDASTDNSADVAKALTRDPRVTFRRHGRNHGHIATYNEGIEWLTSDYMLLISADDALVPGALERAARVLDAHPGVSFTYGNQIVFSTESLPQVEGNEPADFRIITAEALFAQACGGGDNPVPTPTAVVRTSEQKAVGGYRPELPHTGDLEMWLRLATRGDIGVLTARQAMKRVHGSNMELTYLGVPDLEQRRAAFTSVFEREAAGRPELQAYRAVSDRSLANFAFWSASKSFERGDTARCNGLLRFAATVNPELRDAPEWKRLKWKLRLGTRAWRAIAPILNRFRAPQLATGER
jgi:glycosyltransferase involved in cell wall biosynthesis